MRIWTKDWPIPSSIKLKKYSVDHKTSHNTNVRLSRFALWGLVEDVKEFKRRTYNKHEPIKWGKGKNSGRRFNYELIDDKIWIKILSKHYFFNVDGRTLNFDGNYLRLSLYKNEIAFWYTSGEGQVRFVILPKFIDIDEGFFELIGFLDGEMSKKINMGGGSALKISNTESLIIKEIIERFKKYFNINPDSWTASLTFNNKSNIFNGQIDKRLKKIWSEEIGLSKNRFTKTTFQKKYNSLFSQKGIIQIRYSNTLFFLIFLDLMENLNNLILKNYDYCVSYIRGIAAAEGGIGKRDKKLRIVHIGSMDNSLKSFYKKCLIKIGIDSIQTYKLRIEICGLRNFLKLNEINIFMYHPRRNKEFEKALQILKESPRYKELYG